MKTKILICDTAPLYPPRWGGPKRIWNLFASFDPERFDITYVGLDPTIPRTQERWRDNRIREILCPYPRLYRLWHLCQKLVFGKIVFDLFFIFGMSAARSFKHAISAAAADIVICSHPWAMASLSKRQQAISIYDAHNCEYNLMNQILGLHPCKTWVLRRVKKIEQKACAASGLILVSSLDEQEELKAIYGLDEARLTLVPNGATIRLRPTADEKKTAKIKLGFNEKDKVILFIGSAYGPNIEAAAWIIHTLAKTLDLCRFLMVGGIQKAFQRKKMPANVTWTGVADEDDLGSILKAADIGINPVLLGSGTNIKLLDYLGAGLPSVATAFGCRGLNLEHRKNIWVSSRDDFSKSIETLLADPCLADALAREGHHFAEQHHDWQKISLMLQEQIS